MTSAAMRGILRLLQVEDSESDADLVLRRLRNAGYEVSARRLQDADEMRAALSAAAWDLIVCDYRLPGFDAPAALAILHETGLDIPFVVVSGTIGEDLAVELMKAGANDYLMKDRLARLPAAVERELRDAKTRAERKAALERLTESEAQLALAIESTGMGVFDYDLVTGRAFYSELTRQNLGVPAGVEPSQEKFLEGLHPEDQQRVRRALDVAYRPESGGQYAEAYRIRMPVDADYRWISARGRVLFDAEGGAVRFLGVVLDVTEEIRARRALEYQLELTALIAEQSTDCIILTGLDNQVRFVNSEAKRAFGYTEEEFNAKTPHDLLHHHYPDGRLYPASECAILRIVAQAGQLLDHEEVMFHKDGTPLDVSFCAVPLRLNGAIIGTLTTLRDITERKRAERALRQTTERFRRLFDGGITGVIVGEGDYIVEANDEFLRMLGYTREEFMNRRLAWRDLTPPEFAERSERGARSLMTTGLCYSFEKEYFRKDGSRMPALFSSIRLAEAEGIHHLCFIVDLTERKNLENQVRQAQKLESVGLLAGGVAHDFNNLLTVIMGYSNMVIRQIDRQHLFFSALDQISVAAGRAAEITRQLLTFSRRHTGAPKNVAMDDLVRGIEQMLQRLIGEDVEVVLALKGEGAHIFADPVLVEQVIVNLAVNARDAMPHGGSLRIATSTVTIPDGPETSTVVLAPGPYVMLAVSDAGTGMTPDVQSHLFEPFFTTKEPGKGTGLGLSTAYGIVKQSGGSIAVESAPGAGTTFRVLLPMVAAVGAVEKPAPESRPAGGTETVLVVEDEAGVRSYVHDLLTENGYSALVAAKPARALEIARQFQGRIDLLVTDVVLPGMTGDELIEEFLALRPGTPVLCMSGYPERAGTLLNAQVPYLAKPFRPEAFLKRVRQRLAGDPGAASGN